MFKKALLPLFIASAFTAPSAQAAIEFIALGNLSGTTDLSGLTTTLENGVNAQNILGGIGSGLAWAGGNTFLALPDRGPNATTYSAGTPVDNTTSYIARFQTVSMALTANTPGSTFAYSLTPTLSGTTLLSSPTALNYGATAGLPSAVPSINTPSQNYFTGRSDNFGVGLSTNPNNARLDPEAIRVSNNGSSVFVADEYGPYVYQFDRATGQRTNTFALPSTFAISNLNSVGASEISGNTSGRVTNKGMEGLAITPDGKTLVGFMQSPLIQDGGDGGQYNRIVKIDIATGATTQFAYNNQIAGKNFNSSEILAVNDHQFLVLERDGKGLGDGSSASTKKLMLVDTAGATEVSGIADLRTTPSAALTPSLFLDLRAAMNAKGITDTNIPAKLEGAAFGDDIVVSGITKHTLWIANDNDFVPAVAGDNKFFVFAMSDADLAALGVTSFQNQALAPVPEPETYALMGLGLGLVSLVVRRRARRT